MKPATLAWGAFAVAFAAGGAFAQADDTNSIIAPAPVPSDIHAPGYADGAYLYEPRHAEVPPYPLTPRQAESLHGNPSPYVDRNGTPQSYFNGGSVGARRDSNPDDFATGIYNPKP